MDGDKALEHENQRIGFRSNFATCWAKLKIFLTYLNSSVLIYQMKIRICLLRLLWVLNKIMSGKYLAESCISGCYYYKKFMLIWG